MDALTRSRTQSLILGGIALGALYLVGFAIMASSAFAEAPDRIAFGIALDLTVTATAIVWWFGCKRAGLPTWIAVAAFGWGVIVARLWVPHAPIQMLVALGGITEAITVGWAVLRIRRVVRTARAARDQGPIGSIETGLRAAKIPARIAEIMASELAVVMLAFTGWFRRPTRGALSMRSTGWLAILGLMGFLVVVETPAIHLLVGMWSPVAAWIATASSAYVLLWLIADIHAVRLYPVAIQRSMLRVTVGVRWRAAIPLESIESVTEIKTVPDGALNLALMEPTVLVTLRQPVMVRGLLGTRRHGDRLALTIDDPKAFIAAMAR